MNPSAGSAGLLHNMWTPPSTAVNWDLHPLGDTVACFEREALTPVRLDDRGLITRLDKAWATYALRGAVDLFPWPSASFIENGRGYREALCSTDPSLVLNVLGRARSQLLLATTPLALEHGLLERHLATDDVRIVRLVRASRHARAFRP